VRSSRRGRRLLLADFFAFATAIWIVTAALNIGDGSLASAGAESLEFFGGYLVARALFHGPTALRTFMRVLKVLAFVSIVLAIADNLSGRLIVHDTLASILHVSPIDAQHRRGMIRATSTFDHAILLGAFCSLVAAMLLYSERSVLKRTVYVGFCFIGCYLSLSSAGLMSCFIVLAVYTYDRLMGQFPWRWRALWAVIAVLGLVVMLAVNHPLGWVITNLTLEPQSGYFRFLIWDAALDQISQSPLTGHGFVSFDNSVLSKSVDSVWLVLSLRFGLPAIAFLIFANVAASLPTRQSFKGWASDSYVYRIRTGLTLVLMMFMFMGLTVHYWNYMWIFWGVCLGIRASLREQPIGAASRSVARWNPRSAKTHAAISYS